MFALIPEILVLAACAAMLVVLYRHVGNAVAQAVRVRLSTGARTLHPVVETAIVALWPAPLAVLVVPPTVRYLAEELRLIGIAALDGFVAACGRAARIRASLTFRHERPREHHGRDALKARLATLRERERAAEREVGRRREEMPCLRCTCSKSATKGRIDVLRRRIALSRAEGRLAAVRAVANRVEAAIFTYHGRLAIMQRVH